MTKFSHDRIHVGEARAQHTAWIHSPITACIVECLISFRIHPLQIALCHSASNLVAIFRSHKLNGISFRILHLPLLVGHCRNDWLKHPTVSHQFAHKRTQKRRDFFPITDPKTRNTHCINQIPFKECDYCILSFTRGMLHLLKVSVKNIFTNYPKLGNLAIEPLYRLVPPITIRAIHSSA